MKSYSLTDIGRKRKYNQDYVYAQGEPIGRLPNLFLVADGMGGHNAGDYASKCAVDTIIDYVTYAQAQEPERILQEAFIAANRIIRQKAQEQEELSGMGTTLVAAVWQKNLLTVANVGDSRLYLCGTQLQQITRDHSLVEEMVRVGGMDKGVARNHPDKNIITRAIGAADEVEIDFFQVPIQEGDIALLCSDGLTNMLEDHEIHQILLGGMQAGKELSELAGDLIAAANENGGKDNIAVVLACLSQGINNE
ncbi:MAG: Stp1/IreP family PP2C-type Ser/Thr phosphatase [Lachnospiraceae bacterium]|jgi:protein phosphatase|nr:Stp1/IreP family PP2C-type Ser/Thr phosphatase [Lachnospiraceae bacterium]